MRIFSGSSNKPLAKKIAKNIGLKLCPLEISIFPDGERRIRVEESVLGEDTVVVESTNTPVDTNYMELFLIIDALKRSGAKSVKVLIPYLGYQRQDHVFRDGEAVALEVIAKILENIGATEFFSFDLHTPKIPEIFTIPAHNLSALSIFAEKIKNDFNHDDLVLVSPDMGGIRRIKEVSENLDNLPYATIEKNRDLSTGDINDSQLNGDVRGKVALMVDDIISTGTTLVDGANLLIEQGVTKVFAFATHAILAGKATDNLQHSQIERVFVSDTIDIPKEKHFPKLEVLSVAQVVAKTLKS